MEPDKTRNLAAKVVAIGLISIFGGAGLATGCKASNRGNEKEAPEIEVVDVSNVEADKAEIMGSWKPAEDQTVTGAQREIFEKAMENLVGAKHEPVAYLASQIVSGTNHCFLAKSTTVRPGAAPRYTLVYIYEDLSKNVQLLNIEDLELPGTKGDKAPLGGFTFCEDPAITPALAAVVDKASQSKLGAEYKPVANIGSQVINGTNHVVLCKITATTPGNAGRFALVQIRETVDGKCDITEVTDLDISAVK